MTSSDVANLRIQIGDHDIYNPNEVKSETRTAVKVLYHKGFTMERLVHGNNEQSQILLIFYITYFFSEMTLA